MTLVTSPYISSQSVLPLWTYSVITNKPKTSTTPLVHIVCATNKSKYIHTHFWLILLPLFFQQLPQPKTTSKPYKIKIKKKIYTKTKPILRLLTQHQIQTKLTHPAVLTTRPPHPPGLLHFPFAPPSVPDKLHILAVPSVHFHNKLNGFQQLAYLWVTIG